MFQGLSSLSFHISCPSVLHDNYLLWNAILVENHQVASTDRGASSEAKLIFSWENVYHLDFGEGTVFMDRFPNIEEPMSLSWMDNLKSGA